MLNCYKKNIAPVVEKVLKLGDPASFWKGFSVLEPGLNDLLQREATWISADEDA